MWSPTHVQVVVQRARGLLTKGKNKSNDCFVTIALGKEKYQTSVKEKASENVEWHEECELQIPQQGNTAEIVLTALHRNFLGVDEFLGTVRIPLASFDIYEMPKNRWYDLGGKPGKENTKERGKLEVRIGFIVRAGSLSDLSKKERHKSSLGQLSSAAQSFGGSLLSIGSGAEKRKGLKKLAKSIGNKVKGKSRSRAQLDDIRDEEELQRAGGPHPHHHHHHQGPPKGLRPRTAGQEHADADPGVISDEDDFTFDDLSHKSSTSSLNSSAAVNSTSSSSAWRNGENLAQGDGGSGGGGGSSSPHPSRGTPDSGAQEARPTNTPPSKPPRFALPSSVSVTNLSSSRIQEKTQQLHQQHQQHQQQQQQQQQQANAEDEWGQKLYGFQAGSALKRWENKRNSPKIVIEETRDSAPELSVPADRPAGGSPRSSPVTRLKGEIALSPPLKDKDKYKISKEAEKQLKREKKEREKSAQKSSSERIIIGGEERERRNSLDRADGHRQLGRLPRELLEQFDGKSREDLIELVLQLQMDVADKKKRLHDLEDYIDALLLRVIECSPRLLQNPWQPNRRLSSPGHQ